MGYGPTDRPTDRRTDQRTNRRTDKASYRDAWTHLKTRLDIDISQNQLHVVKQKHTVGLILPLRNSDENEQYYPERNENVKETKVEYSFKQRDQHKVKIKFLKIMLIAILGNHSEIG